MNQSHIVIGMTLKVSLKL